MTSTAVLVVASAALVILLGTHWARTAPRHDLAGGQHLHAARLTAGSAELVDVIERTSRDVRSGVALRPALLAALDQQPTVLPAVRSQLTRGVAVQQALTDLRPPPRGDAAFVVHGLRLAAHTGGAMADTLDRVVAVVRERMVWRGERHAQAAQARLSARMLTLLPMAVAAWGLASGPRVRHAYGQSPAAGVLTALGIALNLIGWWWMRRLVRGSDAP